MLIALKIKATRNLHELVAGPGHASAAVGVGLALATEARASALNDASILWVREASAAAETGDVYGPGLMTLGMPPDGLIIVGVRTRMDALRAALEGVRCAALSAVVLETCNAIDLTASRRLKLASEKSGVAVVLIRLANESVPNAAQVRWRVNAAPQAANARLRAAFKIEVLKHPAGFIGKTCLMEWDHEQRSFAEAVSVPLAALPDAGPLAA